jgi:hypothetical protein
LAVVLSVGGQLPIEDAAIAFDLDVGRLSLSPCQTRTWFAVSTGLPRSCSMASIAPTVRQPLPPKKIASASAGTYARAHS